MPNKQKGYTIIEVLIFLAISSVLFATSVIGMNGQLERSRFKQSMETIQADIVSILDSVDKGYTLSDGNKTCTASGNSLIIRDGVTQSGSTASNCLFYGRDIDICTTDNQFLVSTYLANNKAIIEPATYPPQNMASLATTITLPSGVIFVPSVDAGTSATTGCHMASLYQNSNENYQKVPRFKADSNLDPSSSNTDNHWKVIPDTAPLKWCFQDGPRSSLVASITISQVNVLLNIGDEEC